VLRLEFRGCVVVLRVEADDADGVPVAGLAGPALRVEAASGGVDATAGGEDLEMMAEVAVVGATKLIVLCRCLVLYQSTKRSTQAMAVSMSAKGREGKVGRYLRVGGLFGLASQRVEAFSRGALGRRWRDIAWRHHDTAPTVTQRGAVTDRPPQVRGDGGYSTGREPAAPLVLLA
jgi:hypothetical protein